MNLTHSNGFAPFVRSQHNRRTGFHLPAPVTHREDNFDSHRSGVINIRGGKSENNGNGSDLDSITYNRNYDPAISYESRHDRETYRENENHYGKVSEATSINDRASVPMSTGRRVDSGSSSSSAELSNPIKRQRHEYSPQAAVVVQTADHYTSNATKYRTREEIEAIAYSQGAKKGG